MNVRNEDVQEITLKVPDGHRHLRTQIILQDGTEITLQEATVANIVRAYIAVKTDPRKTGVRLLGQKILDRKDGFAEWQLLEES